MNRRCRSRALRLTISWSVVAWALGHVVAHGEERKNPASKIYVADVAGDALIDTGEAVEDLTKRSVYTVQGAVIETKKPAAGTDRAKAYSTMVYSNGTGAFFDADTRVEVRKFVQEPFVPNRTDVETEPSISQTQAFLARGAVGLCNSKLVAGSSMTYQTPHASVNIRGKKVVIEANDQITKISMIDGESTVRAGPTDTGGHTVHAGEQAIIRTGAGGANQIEIRRIPPNEAPALDDKVTMACMAKRTVYFEERERPLTAEERTAQAALTTTSESGNGDAVTPGRVSVFDTATGGSSTSATTGTVREIVPIEIVPTNLPTQFVVSPATIITPTRQPGG